MNAIQQLEKWCKQRGAELVERPNGHYQIKGPLLVNYYPNSKKRSAYIAGTTEKKTNVEPAEAVAMAFKPPKGLQKRDKRRKKGYRAIKERMWRDGIRNCHWCGVDLTLETATLEHVIPLARGGLDNDNNRTLACEPCNRKRGSTMPELKK